MNLVVLSPDKEIFNGAIKSVTVPGTSGRFELLNNHAAIVSSLQKGNVRVIKADGERMEFEVNGGFVECLNNEVALLVSSAQID